MNQVESFSLQFSDFINFELKLSKNTHDAYVSDIKIVLGFFDTNNISFTNFTEEDIRDYMSFCYSQGKTPQTVWRICSSLRAYIKFLKAEDFRDDNPLKDIVKPKTARMLPDSMSEKEVDDILEAPDVTSYVGCRDKAMMELLYATGLRVSELCSLKFDDLHFNEKYILVRGKGDKDRIIPVVDNAILWVQHYINNARPLKDPNKISEFVFISQLQGDKPLPMTRVNFWMRVKKYAKDIGMKTNPSPHTFRHAFATHLLNHEADLRSIQMMLGHASLTTTEIYTHVAIERMHKVFNKTHPRA